jgi:hypothetical protein
MEKSLVQLVNTGLAGEPEHLAFQDLLTNHIIEFYKVRFVEHNGVKRAAKMPDDWRYVYQHLGHKCYATWEEDGDATLYFD